MTRSRFIGSIAFPYHAKIRIDNSTVDEPRRQYKAKFRTYSNLCHPAYPCTAPGNYAIEEDKANCQFRI